MDLSILIGIDPSKSILNYQFIIGLLTDLIVIFLIARKIYFPATKNREYVFTFYLFNVLVFFVCFLMDMVNLSIGFAFGVFAIFSILRYRTQTVPIKEMTYLFISIAIAMINALGVNGINIIEVVLLNLIILVIIFLLEKYWVQNESSKEILFEKIELIKPERESELIADLCERTGLKIDRIEIGKIDFMRDIAEIKVFYT
jgi:uncharacterized membrane protein